MILSILILAVSAAAFLYWLRYVALLILQAEPIDQYAPIVAAEHNLQFPAVAAELGQAHPAKLDELHKRLERDYERLQALLRKAQTLGLAGSEVDELLLRAYYRLASLWLSITRPFSEAQSRLALAQMTEAVACLASFYGRRLAQEVSD